MDFERKKRNVTYSSDSCKMYLRHDFKHRCAYCGSIEEALSPMPEAADKLFEKDHFLPQSKNYPDADNYSNLFYSCGKCNGKKSNVLLSLNPCQDDIFTGSKPHITGGTSEKNFVLEGTSPEGVQFIADLELNSQYRRRLRKKQHLWLLAKQEGVALLEDPRYKEKLSAEDLKQIKTILSYGIVADEFETICGGSDHALNVIDACYYLNEKGYHPNIVLEENEIDITVEIGGKRYCGTVRIESSITDRKLKTRILAEQRKRDLPFGLFVYIPDQCIMCFYEVNFDHVNWDRTEYRVSEYILL